MTLAGDRDRIGEPPPAPAQAGGAIARVAQAPRAFLACNRRVGPARRRTLPRASMWSGPISARWCAGSGQ